MNHSAPNSGWTVLPAASASASAGPSLNVFTTFAATPSVPSDATASTPSGRGRRLSPEARQILIDFYHTVTTFPDKQQRIQLAERVRQAGCADYDEAKVYRYFVSKRKADRDKACKSEQTGPKSSAMILYPSLMKHPSIIPDVETCLKDLREPSPAIAEIIASKIGRGVKCGDILTYAKLRREGALPAPPPMVTSMSADIGPHPHHPLDPLQCAQQPFVSNALHQYPPRVQLTELRLPPFERSVPPTHSQLPTPASSTSPEPRSPVVDSQWGKVEVDDDDDVKDELLSDEDEATETEGSAQPPEVSLSIRMYDLAGHLQESLSRLATEEPRSAPPKTFAELASWLKQEDTTSSVILQGIQQGVYAPLGLSMASP